MPKMTSIPFTARDYKCIVYRVTKHYLLMTYCATVLIRVWIAVAETAAIDNYC